MTTQETTHVEWIPLDLRKSFEVVKYLSRDVEAVELPEKVSSKETYPGLILDGASGVGKTQQAFSMLKSMDPPMLKSMDPPLRLVYQLLVPERGIEQQIYAEMRILNHRLSGRDQVPFLFLVNEAISEARTRATTGDDPLRDPFSVPFLSKQAKLDFQQDHGLGRLMVRLAKCMLRRAPDQTQARDVQEPVLENLKLTVISNVQEPVLENPEVRQNLQDAVLENLQDAVLENLQGAVLFLDEVLPSKVSPEATAEHTDAANRLRFLRNFGRALGMRVVMAGTAATAANMIGVANPSVGIIPAASRVGKAEVGWMEICFLWSPVRPFASAGLEHRERPWLAALLEDKTSNVMESSELKSLATDIADVKNFSPENKLIWLSGPWLASTSELQVSPFQLRSAELVRGHFFEPAIAMHINNGKPYVGTGLVRVKRVKGFLRIVLHRHKIDDAIWWVIGAGKSPFTAQFVPSASESFSGIEYSLSHCVQACLATEPILAVCLSISHDFEEKAFQTTFGKLWQETLPQRTLGKIDGELNEYAVFAALQLACRKDTFPNTLSVKDMLIKLCFLLSVEPAIPPIRLTDILNTNHANIFTPQAYPVTVPKETIKNFFCEPGKRRIDEADKPRIEHALGYTMMPWLVPACSLEALMDAVGGAGEKLFGDAPIAGLVPGVTNASFDACAYWWAEGAPLEWAFEFKARSASYSLTKAIDDLNNKCAAFEKMLREEKIKAAAASKKRAAAALEVESSDPKFHAMLVGITGVGPTQVRVWLEGTEQLRIVLLVYMA
jgi:hypothetical protein